MTDPELRVDVEAGVGRIHLDRPRAINALTRAMLTGIAQALDEFATDPAVQRARFEADMELKQRLYGERFPVDEDFLAALEHGMPQSSGIAMGFDRLAMLCSGAESIEQVLWLPVAGV